MARPEIVGKLLAGRYEVLWKLGEGGLSSVYAAAHVVTGRKVAIKVLRDMVLDGGVTATELVLREAKMLGEVQHPNVCAVLDADVSDGTPFLVLEYLDGRTLGKELAQRGPFSLEEATDVVLQAAAGLDAAHRLGIVHRDVKPDNIVLQRGVVKILDFGIAKRQAQQHSYVSTEAKAGTPAYMAPEQHLDPASVDRRADVYGLAKVYWELLSGERPTTFESEGSIRRVIRKTTRRRPTKVFANSPALLDELLERCFAADPSERPDSMRTFAAEVRRAVGRSELDGAAPRPVAPPRRLAMLLALAAIAMLVAAGITFWPAPPPQRPTTITFAIKGAPTQTIRFRGATHTLPYRAELDPSTIAEAVVVQTPGQPSRKIWLTLDTDRELDVQSHAP